MLTHLDLAKLIDAGNWQTIGDNTQYKIVDTHDELVIAFCGSTDRDDWWANFDIQKRPYRYMSPVFLVHRGFANRWKACHDFFLALAGTTDKPITITGHSHGGALALLCLEDIRYNYPMIPLRCVTFGCPRVVGWWNFFKVRDRWFGTTQYRNGNDIVTHAPFVWMFYLHVTKQVKLVGKGHDIWEYIASMEK